MMASNAHFEDDVPNWHFQEYQEEYPDVPNWHFQEYQEEYPGSNTSTRMRRNSALMEHAQCKGSEFVKTLKEIGYSKDLNAQDFDCLYDDPDCKLFLDWFCSSVEKDNVLSSEQVDDYECLQVAGKTILEELQQEENLSTCHSLDESSTILEEIGLEALGDYECSLEKLEAEEVNLECLIALRNQTLKGFNLALNTQKWDARALGYSQKACDKEKEAIAESVNHVNQHMNLKLLKARESLGHLACSYSDEDTQGLPPMLLSKMALSQYVRLEERCEQALANYTKVTIENVENSGAPSLEESTREVLECSMEHSKQYLQQELHKLQSSHFSRLWEQCSTQAALCSHTAALHWAEKALDLYRWQAPGMEEQSFRKVIGLQEQLLELQEEVAQLKSERLLPLLQASAPTFSLSVLLGDLDTEDVRLQYQSSKQQDVQSQLLKQWARQDLLTLALEVEQRDHRQTASMLDEFHCRLCTMVSGLHQRLVWMGNPNVLAKRTSSIGIPVRDQTCIRLWELLDDASSSVNFQQRFDTIGIRANAMRTELDSLSARLQNGFPHLSSIEFNFRELLCLMYNSSKVPLVKSLELSEPLNELESLVWQLSTFLNWMEQQRRSPEVARQRELYVHFFQHPERLVHMVEELELAAQSASGVSRGGPVARFGHRNEGDALIRSNLPLLFFNMQMPQSEWSRTDAK